jgi:hypothetical protein
LIKWSALIFLLIEAFAFSMYFVLYPDFHQSASAVLSLSSRITFVLFYISSLFLYSRQIVQEEEELVDAGGEWEWEPKFLTSSSPGGIINGGFNLGLGTLGFGENTSKWLVENKEMTIRKSLNLNHHPSGDISHYVNDGMKQQELPRYEVCKSSSKK